MTRIEYVHDGVEVDAGMLAQALAMSAEDLKQGMRARAITGRFERGEGEDAGRVRLTFFASGRRVRVIADERGSVLACSVVDAAERPDARLARLDALLDEALGDTFPASDPVAISFGAGR